MARKIVDEEFYPTTPQARRYVELIDSGRFNGLELADLYYESGKAFAEAGNAEQAILEFTNAIRIEPSNAEYCLGGPN